MNRRGFLSAASCLPFLSRLAPKPVNEAAEHYALTDGAYDPDEGSLGIVKPQAYIKDLTVPEGY